MTAVHLFSADLVPAGRYSSGVTLCGESAYPIDSPVDDLPFCQDCVAEAVRWSADEKGAPR